MNIMHRSATVQPLWRKRVDGTIYAHAELRLRGVWLSDIFPPRTIVHVTKEVRDGQTVLVIASRESYQPRCALRPPRNFS